MKNIVKKSIKGIVSIGCLVGLCISLNGATKEPVKHNPTPVKTQQLSVQQPKEDKNKGVLIKSENWLNESEDENKDLKGNVIIEDDNKVIEISKNTYDEIEHGENSDLKGDVYLGNEDIINNTNVMNHQVESLNEFKENFKEFNILDSKDDGKYYTINLNNGIVIKYEIDCDMFYVNGEDYESLENAKKCVEKLLKDKYTEYKNGLISQYGEDTYKLMNQEAGIENEQQSFEHYLAYGI